MLAGFTLAHSIRFVVPCRLVIKSEQRATTRSFIPLTIGEKVNPVETFIFLSYCVNHHRAEHLFATVLVCASTPNANWRPLVKKKYIIIRWANIRSWVFATGRQNPWFIRSFGKPELLFFPAIVNICNRLLDTCAVPIIVFENIYSDWCFSFSFYPFLKVRFPNAHRFEEQFYVFFT